jgi:hypothetical protein
MFRESTDGAATAQGHAAARRHRSTVSIELITTAALAISTVVAVTAVSIGIARTDAIGTVAAGEGAPIAIALFVALLIAAIGTFTAIAAVDPARV